MPNVAWLNAAIIGRAAYPKFPLYGDLFMQAGENSPELTAVGIHADAGHRHDSTKREEFTLSRHLVAPSSPFRPDIVGKYLTECNFRSSDTRETREKRALSDR